PRGTPGDASAQLAGGPCPAPAARGVAEEFTIVAPLCLPLMNEASQVLTAIEQGDSQAASQLLPLVYDELRQLAAQKLAQEPAGQTLQPTALVHEAYLRLVGEGDYRWDSRGHFFAACAEAMRRILVERARRRSAQKRGGTAQRLPLDDQLAVADRQD